MVTKAGKPYIILSNHKRRKLGLEKIFHFHLFNVASCYTQHPPHIPGDQKSSRDTPKQATSLTVNKHMSTHHTGTGSFSHKRRVVLCLRSHKHTYH